MRVIRQHLVRDGIDILPRVILGDVQFDQVRALQQTPVNGIRPVFFDPREDVREVEDCPGGRAHGVLEGLERERAELEGEAAEG